MAVKQETSTSFFAILMSMIGVAVGLASSSLLYPRLLPKQISHPPIIEYDSSFAVSKGWAEMIRKIYEVDPLLCQSYGGWMRVVSFIDNLKTIDKIIRPLKFSFEAECSPLPHRVQKDLLIRSKEKGEYF